MSINKARWTGTIVIIEDDPATEQSLMDCLSDTGTVVPFATAEDALAYAERGGTIDLVITDIVLGRMNGIEFGHKLTEILGQDQIVPIVYYTSFGDLEMERLAYEAGAADFIEKPISYSRLQLRVKNLLDISRRSAGLKDKALRDSVTDLPRRQAFIREAGQELGRRVFSEETAALLLFNVRGFSEINHTQGLDVGDTLLSAMGERLKNLAEDREYLVGRYVDDRLMILIPNCDEANLQMEAERLADSIQIEAQQAVKMAGIKPVVQVSASVFVQPKDLRTDVAGSKQIVEQLIEQCLLLLKDGERVKVGRLEVNA